MQEHASLWEIANASLIEFTSGKGCFLISFDASLGKRVATDARRRR